MPAPSSNLPLKPLGIERQFRAQTRNRILQVPRSEAAIETPEPGSCERPPSPAGHCPPLHSDRLPRYVTVSFRAPKHRQCLRLPRLDQFQQQLRRQLLRLRRAHLPALAAPARCYGEDLASDPVGALVGLALMLAGDRMA